MKDNIKRLVPAYILAFAVSFMIYIYEPILTYSTNINDFWFDLKTMMGNVLIYFLILFLDSSFKSPSIKNTCPERIVHLVSGFKRHTHCLAESARWSYWPGRYSLPNT